MSFLSKNTNGRKSVSGRALLAAAGIAALMATTAIPAQAQGNGTLAVEVNSGELIRFPKAAKSVFVADPEIADIQVPSPNSVFVLGKKTGRTMLFALGDDDSQILAREIRVTHNMSDLRSILRSEMPNQDIELRSISGALVLKGEVRTPADAQRAVSLAEGFVPEGDKILNQLAVMTPTQVNLRVRVAEMSRRVSKELGFNWESVFNTGNFALGVMTGRAPIDALGNFVRSAATTQPGNYALRWRDGNHSVTSLLDALNDEGVINLLAEPNLTAVSGETASFLAGGEFPIPVAQENNRTTIEFKKFGVALDFTPTVLSPERISMKVRPEVSDLSQNGAIRVNSIQIPALTVRRAETTVELGSGQSFALAGLISNNVRSNVGKLPGAGDLPVIGPLFQSSRFIQDETELVIIATPYIVKPVKQKKLASPLDGFHPANDLERIFLERVAKPGVPGNAQPMQGVRLLGNAGFSY